MFKRALCIILAVIMLSGCMTQAALAAEVDIAPLREHIGMYLVYEDGTQIFQRWGEYTVPSQSADVRLEPGEYVTVTPMHWLDSRYLSYEILSVVSSDEEVVTANSYLPQIANTDENVLIDLHGGREYLGVKLAAGKPGDADVTVTYRTYLTKDGLSYTDNRLTDTYVQTVHVTVGSPLEIKLKISAEGYGVVNSIIIDTSNAYEQLPDLLRDPLMATTTDLAKAYLPYSPDMDLADYLKSPLVSGGVTSAGAAVSEAYSNAIEANKLKNWIWPAEKDTQQAAIKDTANKLLDKKHNTGKALIETVNRISKVLSALNLVNLISSPAVEGVRRIATIIPYYSPKNLMLDVTVTNKDDSPIIVPKMDIQLDEFLSFSSMKGPWGNTYHPEGFHVYPGETVSFSVPIYARLAVGDSNAVRSAFSDDVGKYAYTGNVTANCQYRYLDANDTTLQATASTTLGAYSKITREDMQRYANSMQYNPEYFVNRFGAHNLQELLYIGCPVEVLILDKAGNELAVIGSGDTEPYENIGLTAAAFGEQKLVLLAPEVKELYQIKVRAVGEGTMDIISFGADANGETDATVYEQLPLAAGDGFELVLSGDSGARLWQAAADGSAAEAVPSISFNRSTLEESLAGAGVSPERLDAVTTAYLKGLVPINELQDSFSEAMRPDEFCGTMLSIYELYHNLHMGSSSVNFISANPNTEDAGLIDVAAFVGLVNDELYGSFSEGQTTLTAEDAARLLLALTEKTEGFYEPVKYLAKYTAFMTGTEPMLTAENPGEGVEISPLDRAKELGLLPAGLEADTVISREDGIAILSDIWERHSRSFAINDRILTLYENTRSGLEDVLGVIYVPEDGNSSGAAMDSFMLRLENEALPRLDDSIAHILLNIASAKEYLCGEKFPFGPGMPEDRQPILLNEASGAFTIEAGQSIAQYTLAYFPDGSGILENRLYLFILCSYGGYKEVGEIINNDYLDEFMVIAEQDAVADYVRMFLPELESAAAEPVVYVELSNDCDSPEVEALERRLSELGFFTSSPDTYYGGSTVAAVTAFQKSVGLEATGIADSETQAMLFGSANAAQLLIDWLNSQG